MGMMVAWQIYQGINIFLTIISGLLWIYCIMTWFVRPNSPVYVFMNRLLEPIVGIFRPLALRLMEKGLMIDVSVLLAVFGVYIARRLVAFVFMNFFF